MKSHKSPASTDDEPLLLSRSAAARKLGCSVSTIKRLEQEGKLKGKRLTKRPTASIYFRVSEVLALAK
jgi:hypothetical protein